jgi:4'-phosphopantetheinyl transferase
MFRGFSAAHIGIGRFAKGCRISLCGKRLRLENVNVNRDPAIPGTPLGLAADAVHIWTVPLDAEDTCLARCWANLSQDEQQQGERFQFDPSRRRYVVTRAALRALLGRYLSIPPLDIEFDWDASGKPRMGAPSSGLYFNVAHSGGLALVAVASGCEVGVDVEQLRTVDRLEQIAERYFHPLEVAELLREPPADRSAAFLQCWTAKEAVLKAVGVGIGAALDRLHVPVRQHDGVFVDVTISNPLRCWLQPLALEAGYVGAVACVGEKRFVTIRQPAWLLMESASDKGYQ